MPPLRPTLTPGSRGDIRGAFGGDQEDTLYLNSGVFSGFRKSAPCDYSSDSYVSTVGVSKLYPFWGPDDAVPISKSDIERILQKLQRVFCFQPDNVSNIYHYLMTLLDSRASRIGPWTALRTIHGDYIGGPNANYKKWYFAAQMNIDDMPSRTARRKRTRDLSRSDARFLQDLWLKQMLVLNPEELVTQVGLYLLCWGEANNIRFMPECICFIYKCCLDYYTSVQALDIIDYQPTDYLDHVITPLYNTLRDELLMEINGKWERADKDHDSIIGYDDMNQLFWIRSGLERILLADRTALIHLPKEQRYVAFKHVLWNKAFVKTYRETRTWLHIFVNFNRVIIIHLAVFWYYVSFHSYPIYTPGYSVGYDNKPPILVRLSITSLAGALAVLISVVGCISEIRFAPRRWKASQPVAKRLVCLTVLFFANIFPSFILYFFDLTDDTDKSGFLLGLSQFLLSIFTVFYLSVTPPVRVFGSKLEEFADDAIKSFTADFYELSGRDKLASIGLWVLIFVSKFVESYFFLTIPLRNPIRELTVMQTQCIGDYWLREASCKHQPKIVLCLILISQFVLFYLDTYLWYVIWNTLFSVSKCFYIGLSIWTPWRNMFARLPKRIYTKLVFNQASMGADTTYTVSKIWNAIIISMYREHYLSIEQVQKLIYLQSIDGKTSAAVGEPPFFISQEDDYLRSDVFREFSEAQRRISFFAKSLTASMPAVREVLSMPSFSVFIPHYSEKIIYLLKEIIREEEKYSHVTLLEYLKLLFPQEWVNFVRDTKMMADEFEPWSEKARDDDEDIPYLSVGYKEASPIYVMRTRIWASLRSQTLYRTIFGFMNYSRALKMLHDLETEEDHDAVHLEQERLASIHRMTFGKFHIIVSMQRYKSFGAEELEAAELLLKAFPELQIAYIDEHLDKDTGVVTYFSCLIDGFCPLDVKSERVPKYRIRLSGFPILGDGKSDNQNHAVIFTRGEYIQLIDANQDNYIEECLKIRSVLAEFEEDQLFDPYSTEAGKIKKNPVAIVGTREYIFSENTGILGDIAAGKEQTFGTLFARTLAQIGGKLHYGHPDFLNSIFMTTRGGVSKAQRGLHLNEDIYAGMTAVTRGGRIKHCEYFQCGKGRDLGFTSILNFITKIGAGMGEQNLSREYYYLGTQLSLHRMLSFYYAHVGFHLNNCFIILSIQLFVLTGINLASLTRESVVCQYHKHLPITDLRKPEGCSNLIPVVHWFEKSVLSVFLVFFMSLLPLAVYELSERGISRFITRISKQMFSMSPIFEIFVCKIYSQSLISDLSVGGAQYIATGRGFATKREAFSNLYTRFGNESLTFGTCLLLMVTCLSVGMWKHVFLIFWLTIVGFVWGPFFFNPNQFSWSEYFVDYKNFIKWLNAGNSESSNSSWISYTKLGRSRLVGVKLKMSYGEREVKCTNVVRPSRYNILVTVIAPQAIMSFFILCAYLFAESQNYNASDSPGNALERVLILAVLPIIANIVLLFFVFLFCVALGPILHSIFGGFPSVVAALTRFSGIMAHAFSILILIYLENFHVQRAILGILSITMIQKTFLLLINAVFLSRESVDGRSNRAFWSGKWLTARLGWRTFTQPGREFMCKVMELSYFAADFLIGHMIFYAQLPILFIPLINTFHSMILMWLKPGSHMRQQVLSQMEKRLRTLALLASMALFVLNFVLLSAASGGLITLAYWYWVEIENFLPEALMYMAQPIADESRKGLHRDLHL